METAFQKIFNKIKQEVAISSQADWVANDPIPSTSHDQVEFIRFYNKNKNLVEGNMSGTGNEGGENTASYGDSTISWDLKNSGFTTTQSGNITQYTYTLVYRVRLTNEKSGFDENQEEYDTNGTTTLTYRVTKKENGQTTISDRKELEFPIPSVKGYLGELSFEKKDPFDRIVVGAEFQLSHADTCKICRGDGTQVKIAAQAAKSGTDGKVTFNNIPSGHTYTLTETKAPDGYSLNTTVYTVVVAYDNLTVTSDEGTWNGTVINHTSVLLPSTGSTGKIPYTISGVMLITASILLVYKTHRRDD